MEPGILTCKACAFNPWTHLCLPFHSFLYSPHRSEIILYLSFSFWPKFTWHDPLCIFIHIVTKDRILSLLKTEFYSEYMPHLLYPLVRLWFVFRFWLLYVACKWTEVYILLSFFSVLQNQYLGMEIIKYMILYMLMWNLYNVFMRSWINL